MIESLILALSFDQTCESHNYNHLICQQMEMVGHSVYSRDIACFGGIGGNYGSDEKEELEELENKVDPKKKLKEDIQEKINKLQQELNKLENV